MPLSNFGSTHAAMLVLIGRCHSSGTPDMCTICQRKIRRCVAAELLLHFIRKNDDNQRVNGEKFKKASRRLLTAIIDPMEDEWMPPGMGPPPPLQ